MKSRSSRFVSGNRLARNRRSATPSLEIVEDRRLLSTIFTVTSLADNNVGVGDSGDLRYVLTLADKLQTGTPAAPDLIRFHGLTLTPSSHTIAIGSGAAGARPLPALTDIAIIDGTSANGFDNATGLLLELDGSSLKGSGNGLEIAGGYSTVQGLEIENFPGNGIVVTSPHNTIGGDEVGLDSSGQPNNPAGRITDTYPTGSTTPVFVRPPLGNIISGNGGDGLQIQGAKAQFNLVEGNFIGTDVTGTVADGNGGNGVSILSANHNTLMGTTPPDMNDPFVFYNVISANHKNGLLIDNSHQTTVYANFFGLGSDNKTPLGNTLDGVLIDGTSDQTTFGANIPLGNVTSANGKNGLEIAGRASRTISANTFAGVAAFNPSAIVGNHGDGILVTSNGGGKVFGKSGFSTILLTCQTSGNLGNGIEISGPAKGVQVSQTVAGLQTNGITAEPNQKNGIAINGNASNVSIGGFEPSVAGVAEGKNFLEASNLISGNLGDGVAIVGRSLKNIQVVNSLIGTQIKGNEPAANGRDGVSIVGASNVQIGPKPGISSTKDQNIIAFNRHTGVAVQGGNQDKILGNSIHDNGTIGISLGVGSSDKASTPVLTSAKINPGTDRTQVKGTLNGEGDTTYQVEIFGSATPLPGNGENFLGFATVKTNSRGSATFFIGGLVNPDPTQALDITATATGLTTSSCCCQSNPAADGNTSPFSKPIVATT